MPLNPMLVRQSIENLKVAYPALLEDDQSWQMSLESETDIDVFLTNIVRRIEDTKGLVVGMKDRFDELKARKDRFETRIEALRELAFKMMSAAEIVKRELPEATLSLRAGQQQLVGERDPMKTPDMFCKITREIDRTKVKEHLKSGGALPGFELSNSSPSLSIRIK